MIKFRTGLIRKGSIEEIVARRDRALELYLRAARTMQDAHEAAKLATENQYGYVTVRDLDGRFPNRVRAELDRRVWQYLRDATNLRNVMDAQTLREFDAGLERDPPTITVENVRATFQALMEDKDQIFVRGLVNVFRRLDPKTYRTNDAFKVGEKAILNRVVDFSFGLVRFNHWGAGRERISDLDRIFHVLDGKPPPDHRGDAGAMVGDTINQNGDAGAEVTTEYMRLKWFKNGNLHIWFRRADLLASVNRIIAEHYGETLADATDRH